MPFCYSVSYGSFWVLWVIFRCAEFKSMQSFIIRTYIDFASPEESLFTTFILHCKFDNYAKIDTGSFIKLIDVNLIRAYVSVSEVCKWSFQLPKIDTKTFKNTYYQACFYFAQKSSVDLGLCEYFSGIFNDYIVVGTAVLHFAGLGMHNNHLFESYFLYWKSLGVVLLFSSFFL